MSNLINTILAELKKTNTELVYNQEVYNRKAKRIGNEFLFILKPEIFYHTSQEQIQQVLELVFSKFDSFDLQVDNIRLLNSDYLKENNVIAKHYGVINSVSKNANQNLTQEAINNFRSIYKKNLADEKIYGSLELLDLNIGIDDEKLAGLWKLCDIKRLAGGIYAGEIKFNDEVIYIVNGFHPPQLNHFIDEGRMIITMNLSGKVEWKEARQKLIGNTYPEKAEMGTIRRDLFEQFGKFGFEGVSYVINSVHLSAGPLEGLIELMRFNTVGHQKPLIKDFLFGNILHENFSNEICNHILTNPIGKFKEKEISVFDLSEELNSEEAIHLFRQIEW